MNHKEIRAMHEQFRRLAFADDIRELRKKWRIRNKGKITIQSACYYKANRCRIIKSSKDYYIKHRLRVKEKHRSWNERNRDKINRSYKLRYQRPDVRIRQCLSNRLRQVLKGEHKSKSALDLLGCSVEDFWIYLESRFEPGMTRENYGLWHIDHIMPCAIFDLTKPEHQKRCFHFSNMQPMWAADNQRKRVKVLTNQYNLL